MYSGNTVPLVGGRHPILLECNLVVIFFQSVLGNAGIDCAAFFLHYLSFMTIFCLLQRLISAEVESTDNDALMSLR
jgi:hypothetical protein